MMNKFVSYRRIIVCLFIVLISYVLIINLNSEYPVVQVEDAYGYTAEGYVVSKRLSNKIWIADEPTSFINRVTGHLFSEYKGLMIVSEHQDAKGNDLFHNIKVNQKVRV